MEGIQISINRVGARGDIALLRVRGYVDTTTSSELHKALTAILKEGIYQLIVDLGAVNYVSSAGWGVFVGEIKGIRENGGDIKIVQMMPEVRDVFEMLEFDRILTTYDSVEEAMDDFDLCMGLDITKSIVRRSTPVPRAEAVSFEATPRAFQKKSVIDSAVNAQFSFAKPKVEESTLPLVEKIKILAIENPNNGALKIKKALYSRRFGYTKVSWFKIRSLLKKYNLETKEKRYRFYRSR